MNWYILKVQSNREESIREGLQRRVAMAGLDRYFGEIIVPTEMVSEFKGGKKRVVKRKLYPGYSSCTWRSTTIPGSWCARRRASAISPARPASPPRCCRTKWPKIVAKQEEKTDEAPEAEDQLQRRATA